MLLWITNYKFFILYTKSLSKWKIENFRIRNWISKILSIRVYVYILLCGLIIINCAFLRNDNSISAFRLHFLPLHHRLTHVMLFDGISRKASWNHWRGILDVVDVSLYVRAEWKRFNVKMSYKVSPYNSKLNYR